MKAYTQNIRGGTHLLFLVILAIISYQPKGTESRSLMERELHPIDICIFTCDMCYKEEALVYCANECITSEAAMGPFWVKTCRLFARDAFHGLGNPTPGAVGNTNFMP